MDSSIKRYKVGEKIRKKKNPTIVCLQETHFTIKKIPTESEGTGKKIFQANGNWKKAGIAIIISDKINFKS